MSSSPWPGKEIKPSDERVLLWGSRLRLFGVNYLQGAVCQDLGLLAHLEGSSVLLLPLRSGDGRGNANGSPTSACVCRIDLRARRLGEGCSLDDAGRHVDGKKAIPIAAGLPAIPKPCPARGVSWSPCRGSSRGSDLHKDNARGSRGISRPEYDEGQGEIVSHLAVAQGSTVHLWRVSRSIAGPQESGGEGRKGWRHGNYRFVTEEVRTGWNDAICGGEDGADQDTVAGGDDHPTLGRRNGDMSQAAAAGRMQGQLRWGRKRVGSRGYVPPSAVVRCISFRPFIFHASAGAAIGGDGPASAVPLAAWSGEGAIMLGTGGMRSVYPPPVAKKRVCGAWSGCGRRLAVSSGGEIRVYVCPGDDRSHDKPRNREPAACEARRDTPSSRTYDGREVREGAATATANAVGSSTVGGPPVGDGSSTAGVAGSFRTILCVESAMQENGTVTSTDTSLRSGSFTPPRGSGAASPALCTPADGVSTNRRPKLREGGNHHASMRSVSRSVGDMRSMCSAGPLAFFGTTDGGLGLESLFISSGSLAATNGDIGGGSGVPRLGTREDTLLKAVLSDRAAGTVPSSGAEDVLGTDASLSTSIPAAAGISQASPRNDCMDGDNNDSYGSGAGDGFRHVLPGENWLARSLRPWSGDSRAQLSRGAACRSAPVAEATLSFGDDAPPPLLRSSEALNSPKAVAKIIDLRGKIGNGRLESGVTSAESSHPLFRLSLGTEGADNAPSSLRSAGKGSARADLAASAVNGCELNDSAGASSGRRPWLVLITCSNAASKIHVGNGAGREGGGGDDGGCDEVELHSLALLPSALSSPDLLAASDGGRFVAVGGHACGLVACYRLSPCSATVEPVAAVTPATDYVSRPTGDLVDNNASEFMVSGAEEAGLSAGYAAAGPWVEQGEVDRGDHFRQQERPGQRNSRRADPLCTLRLPLGYRAKGLAFVNSRSEGERNRSLPRGDDGNCDVDFAGVADGGVPGEHPTRTGSPLERGQEVVLVLAACPALNNNSDDSNVIARSTVDKVDALSSAPRGWRSGDGGGVKGGESTFRTVLLRFVLPTDADSKGNVVSASSPSAAEQMPLALFETQTTPECLAGGNRDHPELGELSPSVIPAEPRSVTINDSRAVRGKGKTAREKGSQLTLSPGSRVDRSNSHQRQEALAPPQQEICNQEATAAVTSGVDHAEEETSLRRACGQPEPSLASCPSRQRPIPEEKQYRLPDSSPPSATHNGRSPGRGRQYASVADRMVVGSDVERGNGRSGVGFSRTQEAFFLNALAKVERGIGERLERVERILVGLSDRVGTLEHALANAGRNAGEEERGVEEADQRR